MTLHVVHVAQPTTEGVAQCVADLVRHQRSRGLRVSVVCPRDGWLARTVAESGAVHVDWPAQRNPDHRVVKETAMVRQILRRLRPDLVHAHSAKAGLAVRLALRGSVPTVYQPHAWSFLAVSGPLKAATLAWERWALRYTDVVVCVSEAERSDGVEAGLRLTGRVRVVPNAVDTSRFSPRDRRAARERLQRGDEPLAVCVGRLSEQKGQDILLHCWPALRARVPRAELALVGAGPREEELRTLSSPGVSFVGNSADPRDWYAAADVVVVPSRWEGMALVPLEALACGRSVVMFDVAGASEAVPPDGGAVVPAEDQDALAVALERRLVDRRLADEEGARGRLHVVAHFGSAVAGDRMLEVYDQVLRGVSRRRSAAAGR